LQQLGYGLTFDVDCQGQAINPHAHYQFVPESGWQPISHSPTKTSDFSGQLIHAIGHYLIAEQPQRALDLPAKQLMRLALKPCLGDTPLTSKQFFSLRGEKTAEQGMVTHL
jgi:DNA repair protein RecO (recombination protein O)